MKQLYLLFFLSATVCAQSIDYTVDLIDINRQPVYFRYLQQTYGVADGVYLKYGFGLNTAESTVSYFDGQTYRELYTSPNPVKIVGATEKGAFALEAIDQEPFDRFLLFISNKGGVDTLNSQPLPLPETYQLGRLLYTFSHTTGVITYTETGEETVVTKSYNDCACGAMDRYFQIGKFLFYNNQHEYVVTDGTAAGTKRVFNSSGQLFELDGRAVFQGGSGIQLYDPVTSSTTDLSKALAGIAESLYAVSVTPNGLILTGSSAGESVLLVTDGTAAGTRKLKSLGTPPTQSSGASVESVGNYILFREEAENNRRRYWLTDGTVAGTRFAFEVPAAQFGDGVGVTGYRLSDGHLLLAFFSSIAGKSFVYSVDVSKADQAATLVASVSFDLNPGEPRVVNDRLLVGGSYLTDELYSFGTTAGDLQYVGKLDVFADLLYATEDEVFYLNSENGPEAIYASRALAGDLERILPVGSGGGNELADAAIFQIGSDIYAHTFDPRYGEAIFAIDEGFKPHLVTDLYPNTGGKEITRIFGLGNKVLWVTRGQDKQISYLSDGTVGGSQEIVSNESLLNGFTDLIGNIATRYYFSSSFAREGLYEFDATTAVTRELKLPFKDAVSNPLFIDGLVYAVLEDPKSNENRQIRRLISFDPLTNQTTVIGQDTTVGRRNRGFQSIATDGKVVYYTTAQGGKIGPSVYDPIKESIVDLGGIDAQATLYYRQFSDRVLVDYNRLPYGKAARVLSPLAMGLAFQVEIPESIYGVALESGFITVGRDGLLYSIDYSSGQGTPLTQRPVDVLEPKTFVKVAPNKAILFWDYAGEHAIWQTDGSKAGTRVFSEWTNSRIGTILAVQPVGDLLAVLTPGSLNLLDPASGVLQQIAVQLDPSWPQPPLAVVNDRLYFSAIDPVYGEELHYLTAGQVNAPTTATPVVPEVRVRVYPNPTRDWVTVDHQTATLLTATLYDITGRPIITVAPTDRPAVNLEALPSGTYFLLLQRVGDNSRVVHRVVRE